MKSSRLYQLAIALLFAGPAALAHSTGAPTGFSGAPNDFNCTECHNGSVNAGSGRLTITFPDSGGWVAGQKYRLRVSLADPTARRWGFELTDRKEATAIFAGAFAVPSGSNTVQIERPGNLQYVTHTPAGTFQQQVTQAGWDIDWTAPAAGTGTIRFYAAGNAANNDGNTTGDKIYTANLPVAEQVTTIPPAITTGNTVFSQFVFGGGWYTAMYFTNQGSSQVTFNANFYTDSATTMSVGGATFKTVLIPAGGTAIVEAQNAGSSTTQGWATFDLPASVTGYGVFRQSVAGKADQEAVVPFASSAGTKSLLTFDESAFTTAVAIWFNGSSSGTVTLAAKDESGASLGTVTITMTPGTKQAFGLQDRLPSISGHRGSVVVSTAAGSMAVLGLRFGGSAFTSIPPAVAN